MGEEVDAGSEEKASKRKSWGRVILRKSGDRSVFKWNSRECTGSDLHIAVLTEELEDVKSILASQPQSVSERFTYETRFRGQTQEGSGEAIHLAVTRNSVPILALLIERRARLDCMVTRDQRPHYDVLHAAVFSEGRGGQFNIIKALLEAKAPPTKNLEGQYPLHKAYQTGARAVEYIQLLATDMQSRGLLEECEQVPEPAAAGERPAVPTPLQLGISNRKITVEKLAQVASLTQQTLSTFVNAEPRSIPAFFARLEQQDHDLEADKIADIVSLPDLCRCLAHYPPAGACLLEALTVRPKVVNSGWHPPPTRMSFGARNAVERFRNMFNPPRRIYNAYARATTWEFDATTLSSPEWHKDFLNDFGPPTMDVEVNVCLMPELICPEFLIALGDADDDDIFGTPVVHATLNTIWWGGAFRVDLFQLLITLVGLCLLVFGQAAAASHGHQEENDISRSLTQVDRSRIHRTSQITSVEGGRDSWWMPCVAREFLGARGFVDLFHELAQVCGQIATRGSAWPYFADVSNLIDLLRACLAMSFFWSNENGYAHVALIALYWARTLEITICQTMMCELMPIIRLLRSMKPSLVVCITAMCAFTHAKWVMQNRQLWPDTLYDSFTLLITAELPPRDAGTANLLFAYAAILCFSWFFMNIFIGVISEVYTAEKEHVLLNFRRRVNDLCTTFLVRTQVLPCNLFSDVGCQIALATSFVLMVGDIVWRTLFRTSAAYQWTSLAVLVFAQFLGLTVCYQDTMDLWGQAPKGRSERPRHVWIASQLRGDGRTPLELMQQQVDDLRSEVKSLKGLALLRKQQYDDLRTEYESLNGIVS